MSQYTVCTELIKYCGKPENVKYLTNILFVFTQENPCKICVDDGEKLLLNEYKSIALNSESLRIWIDLLTNKSIPGIEFIKIDNNHKTITELLFSVCANSYDKNFVVKTKQDYFESKELILKNGINLIDKDVFVDDFKGAKYNIIAKDGGQVSCGDNSPNIINKKDE